MHLDFNTVGTKFTIAKEIALALEKFAFMEVEYISVMYSVISVVTHFGLPRKVAPCLFDAAFKELQIFPPSSKKTILYYKVIYYLSKMIYPYQKFMYKLVYKYFVNKYPNFKREILDGASHLSN